MGSPGRSYESDGDLRHHSYTQNGKHLMKDHEKDYSDDDDEPLDIDNDNSSIRKSLNEKMDGKLTDKSCPLISKSNCMRRSSVLRENGFSFVQKSK